ncbi:MAG: O-Antigen ligase family protein [Burkholderia sp.]|nr:O-Antigen ligase family protein [Burkholderia sp.]
MRYLQWFLVAVCTLFPIVLFVVPRGGNTSFYLLLVISLSGIAVGLKPMAGGFVETLRKYWPLNLAMAGLACAIFANHLALGHFVSKTYDMPFRLACFALLFWIMLLMPAKGMKHLQWGWIVGAIICAVVLYVQTAGGVERPMRLFTIPTIPFGNIGLLMGAFALLSIGWNEREEITTIVSKLAAGAMAVYGSYLSQTRGAWLALPLFLAIAIALSRRFRLRHKFAFFAAAIALLCSSYLLSSAIQKRIGEGTTDISEYLYKNNPNTSLGIRFQLWRGSWLLIKENPVFGIGLEHYPQAVQQLVARHELTPDAASHPHSHNELLFHLTTLGLPGLLAILALYFVPASYFFRERNHPDRETRTVAGMGLALTLGYFVFGLTDVMFYWTVSHTFYAVALAVLFAHLVKRKSLLKREVAEPDQRLASPMSTATPLK